MRSLYQNRGAHLHASHQQADDDNKEEESGPNLSQVIGPDESAARPHMSPIPHMTRYEKTTTRPPDTPHTRKLGRTSFEGIGMRFYKILRLKTEKAKARATGGLPEAPFRRKG